MKIKLLVLITLLFGSCETGDVTDEITADTTGCMPVKTTNDLDTLKSADLFNIQSVEVEGNQLNIQFAYGGGCDPEHRFELYIDPTKVAESIPVQYEARVVFTTNNYCKRLDYKTFCFDLTEFKKKNPSAIIKIRGAKENIRI